MTDTSPVKIPALALARLRNAYATVHQAAQRADEMAAVIAESLGFDPKSPRLHLDVEAGTLTLLPDQSEETLA